MRVPRPVAILIPVLIASTWTVAAASPRPERDDFQALADQYVHQTRPLMQQYCLSCHSTAQRVGELDLEQFETFEQVRAGSGKTWLKVIEMLDKGEMPPEAVKQPEPQQRQELQDWIERYLDAEALAHAGDPGPVVLRRLNNAEYTYTIRDLTGVDLDPVREFPADSAAGEGFTNAGGALVMSPALLAKYLDAGKQIAQHALLLPDGFRFSARDTRRDWTDEILTQIRELYGEFTDASDLGVGSEVGNLKVHGNTRIGLAGRLPLEKYFAATLTSPETVEPDGGQWQSLARQRGLSAKYLDLLASTLSVSHSSLLLDELRARWRSAQPADASALAGHVTAWQKGLWTFGPVGLIGRKGGPTRWMEPVDPLVNSQHLRFIVEDLGKDPEKKETQPEEEQSKQPAKPKEPLVFSLLIGDAGDGNDQDFVSFQQPRLVAEGQPDILLRDLSDHGGEARLISSQIGADPAGPRLTPDRFGQHPRGRRSIQPADLVVQAPAALQIRVPAPLTGYQFLTVAELDGERDSQGSVQVDAVLGAAEPASGLRPSQARVFFSRVSQVFSDQRVLTFVRAVLVAPDSPARDRFELAFREHRRLFPAALCFNQIVPVDEVLTLALFYREDDHLVRLMLDQQRTARLDRLWEELDYVSQSALLGVTALDLLLEALANNGLGDRSQYDAVLPLQKPFEERAARYRERLIENEPVQLDALVEFAARAYRRPLSRQESADLRDLYARLRQLELSHEAAFRLTLARVFVASPFLYRLEKTPLDVEAAPVSDWELASRLSYFLWSSLPDPELLSLAAEGKLQEPEVLAGQARRMLRDPRMRRLATEFSTQWLHIYEFDVVEEKSDRYFPEFADLRGDMYEESIRFFTDLFQRGSLLDLLDADHTFVNQRMADFYGFKGVEGPTWQRVDGVRRYGRGGILGLATTLAKQSGASRTSPILRGNWVSEVLLGEKLPLPPQEVPELPDDETDTDGLTVRQLVARHTRDPQCASCHQRIDPFGFALESYDAIGRSRQRDMAGRPIDTTTQLPDGTEIRGLAGLRDYLLGQRRQAVFGQFTRKLLGYALGREVQLSDQPLLSEIAQHLAPNNYRFSEVVESIVLSRQFREIRGQEAPRTAPANPLEGKP